MPIITYCLILKSDFLSGNNVLSFTEPENWGGMCKNGTRQSPVDLAHEAAVVGHFSKFIFHGYDEALKNPKIINNGHSSKYH